MNINHFFMSQNSVSDAVWQVQWVPDHTMDVIIYQGTASLFVTVVLLFGLTDE